MIQAGDKGKIKFTLHGGFIEGSGTVEEVVRDSNNQIIWLIILFNSPVQISGMSINRWTIYQGELMAWTPSDQQAEVKSKPVCECGAHAVGSDKHAYYCQLKEIA